MRDLCIAVLGGLITAVMLNVIVAIRHWLTAHSRYRDQLFRGIRCGLRGADMRGSNNS